ncbi:MAG: hypothetical protein AAF456_19850, partial [Planctomycetota bacterium]
GTSKAESSTESTNALVAFQFSMRTLCVVVFLVACMMWGVIGIRSAWRYEEAVRDLQSKGAWIYFDYEFDSHGKAVYPADPPGPRWLLDRTSPYLFARVQQIRLQYGHSLENLDSLRLFPDLQRLSWTYGEAGVLEFIGAFPKLTTLNISCTGDPAPIGQLKKLEELWIRNPDIVDLQFLSGCSQLEVLQCDSENLADISALEGLGHIKELTFDYPLPSGLETIGTLSTLQSLSICIEENNVDLIPLANLPQLSHLTIRSSGAEIEFEDIAEFSSLRSLRLINIAPPARSQVEPLITNGLERVELEACEWVKNNSAVSVFDGVSEICADSCYLDTLDGITALKGLKSIRVGGLNRLRNLNCLEGLTSLESLIIEDAGQFDNEDFHVLRSLTGMKHLRVASLSKLENVTALTSLEELDLAYESAVSDLSPLENLTSLKRLNLAGCQSLPGIDALRQMRWLEFLDVGETNLTRQEIETLRQELTETEIVAWDPGRPYPEY